MVTDEEIDATRRKSEELEAQFAKLMEEALDPSKSLEPLLEMAEKEVARLTAAMKTENAPEGTADACLAAACEAVVDWCSLEVAATEGLKEAGALKPEAATRRPAGPRRGGMRI